MRMPKKTRKQKMLATQRKQFHKPTANEILVDKQETIKEKTETVAFIPAKENLSAEELHINKYFEMDLRKSIFIITAIFALEFFFYFATMNNYLDRYLKF